MSCQPALRRCSLEPAALSRRSRRLSLVSVIQLTPAGPVDGGHAEERGSDIVSTQPTPGKLSPDLLQALHGIKSVRLFPKGATLFQQGSAVTGVYFVASGADRVVLQTGQSPK